MVCTSMFGVSAVCVLSLFRHKGQSPPNRTRSLGIILFISSQSALRRMAVHFPMLLLGFGVARIYPVHCHLLVV